MILHSPDISAQLAFAHGSNNLVRVYRDEIEDDPFHGYIAGYSDELAAITIVNECMVYDGFEIIRTSDITEIEIPHPHTEFVEAALELRNLKAPVFPAGIDLKNTRAALDSLTSPDRLITFHPEISDPESVYIGTVIKTDDRFATICEIGPDADYALAPTKLRLADFSRLSIATAYDDALASVAASRGHTPPDFSL